MKKLLTTCVRLVIICIFIFPLWIAGYSSLFLISQQYFGYSTQEISIAGTGSMYPTFPKGEGKDPKVLAEQIVESTGMLPYPNGIEIAGKRYFGYELGHGDIVVVENEKIREMTKTLYGEPTGWVKRIIGLPGDTLQLREGIVYRNEEPLKEPYTAQARSTFGESFLQECIQITVPDNSIFVMGDNRKGSGDSREIGFIDIRAVSYVLPLQDQYGKYDTSWRDTENDFDDSAKITLDKQLYVDLLNKKRDEEGAKALTYQPKLEISAQKRAETILSYNDFSFEATKSGYTMQDAMDDANYFTIVSGEAPSQGYFEAEELLDNQFAFPQSVEFLTNPTFQEIGISEVQGEINGCPTQVIVQHIAGYVPPNYSQEEIDSWGALLSNLYDIQPSWNDIKKYEQFYQEHKNDIDRINEIIAVRIAQASVIQTRLKANQWLTPKEQRMVEQDAQLSEELDRLTKKINDL